MIKAIIYFATILAFTCNACLAQKTVKRYTGTRMETLRQQIDSITRRYNATIGVALVSIENGDTLTINNTHHFPMQSTYKFPLAIAVMNQVDKGKLALAQNVHIPREQLHHTWSPLKDKYPDADVDITLEELVHYTVSMSDNNGCDVLFRLIGGTGKTNAYIHSLGIKDISIAATEEEMGKGWNVQYTNWVTPYAMAQLLEGLFHKKYLSAASNDFLMQQMVKTETGPKRLKGQLPVGTIVAHKTGTSDANEKGMMAATNDVGIITLPNGKHIAIAVYVLNSMESLETNEKIIAEIAGVAFDHFVRY